MFFKQLTINSYRALLVGLVLSVLALVFMVTKAVNLNTQLKQARLAYQNPATATTTDTHRVTTERYVDLTDKEKQEICDRYNVKVDELNDIIRGLKQKVTESQRITGSASVPVFPPVQSQEQKNEISMDRNFMDNSFEVRFERNFISSFQWNIQYSTDKEFSAGLSWRF